MTRTGRSLDPQAERVEHGRGRAAVGRRFLLSGGEEVLVVNVSAGGVPRSDAITVKVTKHGRKPFRSSSEGFGGGYDQMRHAFELRIVRELPDADPVATAAEVAQLRERWLAPPARERVRERGLPTPHSPLPAEEICLDPRAWLAHFGLLSLGPKYLGKLCSDAADTKLLVGPYAVDLSGRIVPDSKDAKVTRGSSGQSPFVPFDPRAPLGGDLVPFRAAYDWSTRHMWGVWDGVVYVSDGRILVPGRPPWLVAWAKTRAIGAVTQESLGSFLQSRIRPRGDLDHELLTLLERAHAAARPGNLEGDAGWVNIPSAAGSVPQSGAPDKNYRRVACVGMPGVSDLRTPARKGGGFRAVQIVVDVRDAETDCKDGIGDANFDAVFLAAAIHAVDPTGAEPVELYVHRKVPLQPALVVGRRGNALVMPRRLD